MNIPKISAQSALSYLKKPNTILPVAFIEMFNIAGRTYQGYERGSTTEAKERIFEETSSAIFWLLGVRYLNEFGDFIGKKVFELENLDIDVGKDSLRRPFDQVTKGRSALAAFKFGKILTSIAISTAVLGYAIPKIKQNMTNKAMKEETAPNNKQKTRLPTMEEYINSLKPPPSLAFKGVADGLLTASHYIENNAAARLAAADGGMITGRVINSRNYVEGREFFIRDLASIYFYLFACAHIVGALNKITKTPDIHPDALECTKKFLMEKLKNNPVSVDYFKNNAYGATELNGINFDKNNVITLDELKKVIDEKHHGNAELMSRLQPERKGVPILSKQQVGDVLSGKWTSDPKFLKEVISKATYGVSDDPKKYISRKTLENIRVSVDDFAKHIIEYAEKNGHTEINEELINRVAKKTLRKGAIFHGVGTAFAVFGLAILIPKLKDYITKVSTGRDGFPGVQKYDE